MTGKAGVQHVFPAALIGQFASPDSRGSRARKKSVWVASRRAPSPFQQAAQRVGYDPRVKRIYSSLNEIGFDLDRMFTDTESYIGDLADLGPRIRRDSRLTASEFITGLVPFVAGLLSRAPQLGIGDSSALGPGNPNQDDVLGLRAETIMKALHLLSCCSQFMLVRDTTRSLFTNDTGYTIATGPDTSLELFIPISPEYAVVVLTPSAPNLEPRLSHVPIRCLDWNADVLDTRRWMLAWFARRESYCPTEEAAAQVLQRQRSQAPFTDEGINLRDLDPPEAFAGFLRKRTPDPYECFLTWAAIRRAAGVPIDAHMEAVDATSLARLLADVANVVLPTRKHRPRWDDLGAHEGLLRVRELFDEEFDIGYHMPDLDGRRDEKGSPDTQEVWAPTLNRDLEL